GSQSGCALHPAISGHCCAHSNLACVFLLCKMASTLLGSYSISLLLLTYLRSVFDRISMSSRVVVVQMTKFMGAVSSKCDILTSVYKKYHFVRCISYEVK